MAATSSGRPGQLQPALLTIVAVAECLGGLAFVGAPGFTTALLLGSEPNNSGAMIGQVAGVALLALGIASWGARKDSGSPARSGAFGAITLYNAGAGFLLIAFAVSGPAHGILVWLAASLHLGLGVALTMLSLSARKRVPSG